VTSACGVMRSASLMMTTFQPLPAIGRRCMRRSRSSTARPRVRAAGDRDPAAPVGIAAQLVGQRRGGGRFANAAGAGEDEGVGVRGGGEGGEAADDGGLAVDVGEAGGTGAGQDVAVALTKR